MQRRFLLFICRWPRRLLPALRRLQAQVASAAPTNSITATLQRFVDDHSLAGADHPCSA